MFKRKTKKLLSLSLSLSMVFGMMPLSSITAAAAENTNLCSTCGDFTDNNGFCTVDGCTGYEEAVFENEKYIIKNAGNLYWFANFVNTSETESITAELTADIDLNPGYTFNSDGTVTYNKNTVTGGFREWTPIGTAEHPFNGEFIGGSGTHDQISGSTNSHKISGIYINNPIADNQGLFGYCGYSNDDSTGADTSISYVGIENSYICGNDYVGSICGSSSDQTKITYCYNSGTVKGNNYVGGISPNAYIKCSYNSGTVIGDGDYVGGVAAITTENSGVYYSYNHGSVYGKGAYVGGICGYGYAKACYNIGTIKGESSNVGAICGYYNSENYFDRCYYIPGTAKDGNGTDQYAIGSSTMGEAYPELTSEFQKTDEQFTSGEVAFLLNGNKNRYDEESMFYQYCSLDFPVHHSYPQFTGWTVYKLYSCDPSNYEFVYSSRTPMSFSPFFSDPYTIPYMEHTYENDGLTNGICFTCKSYQAPKLVKEHLFYDDLKKTHSDYYVIENIGNLLYLSQSEIVAGRYVLGRSITIESNDILVECPGHQFDENAYGDSEHLEDSYSIKFRWKGIYGYHCTLDGNNNSINFLNNTSESGEFSLYDEYGLFGKFYYSTIENLSIYITSNSESINKFGAICGFAESSNIKNCSVRANKHEGRMLGGICGHAKNTSITNCSFEGSISGIDKIGGICGYAEQSYITDCKFNYYSSSSIQGHSNVGGICGYAVDSEITNCDYSGYVRQEHIQYSDDNAGGICGYANNTNITNCTFSNGGVSGEQNIGGICGYSVSSYIESCTNSNTTNSVYGKLSAGGICGNNNDTTIENCINKSTVAGEMEIGGICGLVKNPGYSYHSIKSCSNIGNISGVNSAGGICGSTDNNFNITKCYNEGSVTLNTSALNEYYNGYIIADLYLGGIVGFHYGSTISHCYNKGEIILNNNTHKFGGCIAVGGICGSNAGNIYDSYNSGKVSSSRAYTGAIVGSPYPITPINQFPITLGNIANCYYLEGCATDGSGTVQYGIGNETQGKSTTDLSGATIEKTAEQFKSGEVTYLLNKSQKTIAFYQTCGEDYPLLSGNRVYKYNPETCENQFTNDATKAEIIKPHTFDENGFCQICDEYQPAVKNSDGYYEISNAGQLYWFAALVNGSLIDTYEDTSANAILTADIDLNPGYTFKSDGTVVYNGEIVTDGFRKWESIGNQFNKYSGTFSGKFANDDGHTISGIYICNPNSNFQGLFGRTYNATINNIGLKNSYFSGNNAVGGLCGYSERTNITNCYNLGSVNGNNSIGGICGYSSYDTITDCYNSGSVIGNSNVGGLCGYDNSSTITNCFYLNNCAKINNVAQTGLGNSKTDTTGVITAKTKTQFASGEVAYLLNGENAGTDNGVWKQTVGTDNYPTFKGNTVYYDATGYKLRGTITLKLEETKLAGVYRSTINLPAGTYKFVVDDLVNNKSYGRASTYNDNIANCIFGNNWGYCTLETTGGSYTFTFNSKNNHLEVICNNTTSTEFSTYKLRGSINAAFTKTTDANIIKSTVEIPAGSYKFVVTDDATGITYGRSASYNNTIENALCGNNWGYVNFTAETTGTYEFTYNTKTNRVSVAKK